MKALAPALAAALFALSLPAPSAAQDAADPFQWLEEVDGARAMAWVEGQNARTAARLEADPRYGEFLAEARAIFTAEDRIPAPSFRAGGVDNLWQDTAHPHGVWRHTSLSDFRSESPEWRELIDLDALSKADGRNWFFKGASCLRPDEAICLVRLSDGGGDAVEVREFDTRSRSFTPGGFVFPAGKQSQAWLDADHVVAGREWTPGEVTESGYAYVLKVVGRDGSSREVFRGDRTDVAVDPIVLRGERGVDALMVRRGVTFFENEFLLVGDGGLTRVRLPRRAEYQAYVDGQVIFSLQAAWGGFPAGALISYDLGDVLRDAARAKAQQVFAPGPRQAIQGAAETRNRLVVSLLEDVKGAVQVFAHDADGWRSTRLALPTDSNITIQDASADDDRVFLYVEGFLTPTTLWLADAARGSADAVKALPSRFNAAQHEVQQFWATSSDGTSIPYFLVRRKGVSDDGSTPTIMYGYGGFEVSKPPIYLPEMGRLWLERGGAYVIANIRGGGEFGPGWHQAALREHRQFAFDDFAAVARDLFARKVTSTRRLGIYGRSNGGVLTSVSITQHPDLWNAAVIESPLIDMLRYHKLSAGASWVGEYGDPDTADRDFIAAYSAYQKLGPGMKLPEAYITTNTRDDRVHPGHARKFAAKLEALGYPYLYYENTFGGHANDADPELNARRWARHYVYLAQKLMD
ncbi:MAG: prolyl oligopeptidase family serine peptidase [Phenylobacterium sp.]|uniref:prolyl oligopeptidase family serine peptidase n=1 Tax=Phenylobacterium sp. TaxID=1871053 RepID=UPI00391D26AD